MRRVKFTKEQRRKVERVAKALIPGFRYVEADGDYIRFGHFKKRSLSSALMSDTTVKIPIFELLFTEFPNRLSVYKCGNKTFASLYLVGVMYLLGIDPSSIADYFYEKFQSIEKPYTAREQALRSISFILEEEDRMEHGNQIAAVSEKAKRITKLNRENGPPNYRDLRHMSQH